MNTTPLFIGQEAASRRSFGTRRVNDPAESVARRITLPDHPLPPTRAARTPRSRGVFLAASAHSRLGYWIVNALCIAVAAVSIVAGAEFAEPLLNGKFVSGNAGPGLVASAMRAPIFGPVRSR
jgi:hypothetical protein